MNQYPSHSNMPTFVKNESNTKPVLHRNPTLDEMSRSRRAQFKADFKDFILFAIFAFCAWLLISILLTVIFGA